MIAEQWGVVVLDALTGTHVDALARGIFQQLLQLLDRIAGTGIQPQRRLRTLGFGRCGRDRRR